MRRFVWLIVGLCLVFPVMAQVDSTPTPNPTETLTITSTSTLTPTFTPTVTVTLSPTSTATILTTIEVTAEVTPESTAEATAELTASVQPPIEATVEITAVVTENVVIPEATSQVTEVATEIVGEMTEEATAEMTEPVEITAEVTPEVTPEATAEITEEAGILATATPGGIALRFVQGMVTYQNRPTSAGITVMVWSQADVLLSVATTNEQGIYSIAAPSDEPYWLVFDGELHQEVRVWIEVTQAIPNLVLSGGDLDNDGCIGQSDLNILIANYDQPQTLESDINADSFTNLSDLAILTGNYQACDGENPVLPEESITPEATAEITTEFVTTQTVEAEIIETVIDTNVTPASPLEITEEAAQP
jgi:hypothetical protein